MDGKIIGMINYQREKEIRERDINFKKVVDEMMEKANIVGEGCDKCGCARA